MQPQSTIITPKQRQFRRPRPSLTDRFWAKVNKTETCWLWMGSHHANGYGNFSFTNRGPNVYAHRFAYQLLVGPVPTGLQLDHLCRIRDCVRPEHLEVVTCRQNILRGVGLTAQNAIKTHCAHGHPFDEKNTHYYIRAGHERRGCRACDALWARAARQRERSKRIGGKPDDR